MRNGTGWTVHPRRTETTTAFCPVCRVRRRANFQRDWVLATCCIEHCVRFNKQLAKVLLAHKRYIAAAYRDDNVEYDYYPDRTTIDVLFTHDTDDLPF